MCACACVCACACACLRVQVMSYGTGSGETYLSELTIANLEDTELYRFEPDSGGRLIDDVAITGKHAAL